MAVTFTPTIRKVWSNGDRKEVIYDIACTGTPTVGGDALTAAALKLEVELDLVSTSGVASVVGGTSGAGIAVIHGAGVNLSQVLIVFYVQGTAAAGTSQVAYTGATAGFAFRARAIGKGSATGPAS